MSSMWIWVIYLGIISVKAFRTGVTSLAEMIEERIDTELRERRGIALTEEELARRRVMKRRKERQDFIGHLSTYIGVNTFLIAIWFFTGVGFFWPFFPLFSGEWD